MRVVVTGGAGFIGGNLCAELAAAGHDVVVVDDLSTGSVRNLDGLGVEFHKGSVLDPGLLDQALDGAQAVVHLAAIPSVPRSVAEPLPSHAANATGTLLVLEAARRAGSPHVVVASSSSVYGDTPETPKHEGLYCRPLSPYGVSKLATEAYALAYGHCYGLPVLAFRFFNVFGPLQPAGHAYAAVIPAFLAAALAGRPLPLEGDGTQTRDFTYVGSVVRVLCDALSRGVTSPGPVNLAFGGSTSLRELIGLLEAELGRRLEVEQRPPRAGDVPRSQADPRRLRELFPEIEPVPLGDGLARTAAWMAQELRR